MHNRANPLDGHILANRQAWLTSHGISMNDTSRLLIRYMGDDYCRYKEVGEPQKGLNPFLYQSVATQLDFDKPIRAIAQMYHRVALQSVLVTVMIYIAVQGVRIGAQVPDAHRLKQQPERVEVGQQIF